VLALAALCADEARAGTVRYVTAEDAYLDAGRAEGIAVGQKIPLKRRTRAIGDCEVEQVAEHQARCRGVGVRAGDRFPTPRVAARPPAPAAKPALEGPPAPPRPPLPSTQDDEARRAIAAQLPIEPVAFDGGASWVDLRGRATVRQQAWAISTNPGGAFARPSLDAAMRANFGWISAATAFRVVGDIYAPEDQRFRPDDRVELYVWGASAAFQGGPVVGEVGRFAARKAAGTLILDGAQVGVRMFEETTEIGAYAGAIPDLITIAPSADRLTAGLYGGADLGLGDQILLLPRMRIGAVSSAEFDAVRGDFEAQAITQWRGIGALSLSSRVILGGDETVALSGLRTDLDVTLVSSWTASASYRFTGAPSTDFDQRSGVFAINPTHHASAGTAVEALPDFKIGVLTGVGYDLQTEAMRGYAGPEVAWTPVLGFWRGLSAGYLEEFGTWWGRSAYLGTSWVFDVVRWDTRVSYFDTDALTDAYREFGLFTSVDAPILSWLSLQGRLYGQQALPSLAGDKRRIPSVIVFDLALAGTL
jgi:hypothetical protein